MVKAKPKLSAYDRILRVLAPSAFANRMVAKMRAELVTRQYDAALLNPTSPIRRNARSANTEVQYALAPIRNNVRELIRNAPFAKKGLDVIVNGVVGWGIQASLKHDDPNKLSTIQTLWSDWSNGLCSVDGRTNFFTMQNYVMAAVAADGEVLVRELILDGSIRLQILEADYISDSLKIDLQPNQMLVNGIVQDQYARPQAYALTEKHPNGIYSTATLVPASELIHVYRQDRPEQNRGVSWFAPVVQSLNMLAELQWTQLVRMKLAASLTAVVTSDSNSSLAPDQLEQQRSDDWQLEPGTIRYINPGEKIEFPSVPNPEGFDGSTKLSLREIAAGLGITYESLSNDLSQVNFSSGRMGDLQFRNNVEAWRWHVIIPKFCVPAFERFKKYCAIKGVDTTGLRVDWIPPQRQMIDPQAEVAATQAAIRAGLQTLPDAILELGLDPKAQFQRIAESNAELDRLGLILDCDPRRTANQQLQSADNLQAIQPK